MPSITHAMRTQPLALLGLTPAEAPTRSYVSLIDAATGAVLVTYQLPAVALATGGPSLAEAAADGDLQCVERRYGGATAPHVTAPRWLRHASPDSIAHAQPVTDAATIAALDALWALDRDAD